MATEEVPVPPQYKQQPLVDFRAAPDATRGYKVGVTKYGKVGTKRKLEEYAEQVEREREEMQEGEPAVAAEEPAKRVKHNIVGLGKASGREWKVPGQRAGSLRNPKLATTWEKKMAVKAEEQAFKERKRAAQEARKEAAAEERRRREAAKQRKAEKQAKAAITTRVSSATAKRMMKSKKARKLLRTGDA